MPAFFKRNTRAKVLLLSREPFKVTLTEWRADQNMAAAAQKVLNDQTLRLMLQVLYNSSPAWEVLPMADFAVRAVQQARIEGYTMALANLEALGIHQRMNVPIEATWEPEEETVPITQQ